MLQDELLKAEIAEYKEDLDQIWDIFYDIVPRYDGVLRADKWTKQLYYDAFTMVVTRCFGWSLPSTMLIPMGDCLNHFHIDSQYEVFNRRLHFGKLKG